MNKPTFSIVIPVFNNLELFRRALESVLQQQGVAFEIIVTDDSTTTAIADYVNGLAVSGLPADIHLRYYHHQSDSGAIANWNNGLQMATGQYIILMHHDEAMSGTDYLQRIERHFNGGVDIVVSNIEVIVDGHQKKSHFTTPMKRFALCHPSLLFLANAIGPCACIAIRSTLKEPFCEELHWLVDVEWYYRLLKGRRVCYDPQLTICSIHGHEGQITQELDIPQTFAHDKTIVLGKYPHHIAIKTMLWTYQCLILNTKKMLGRI